MSFKDFSAAHGATAKNQPDDTSKAAPAVDQPPARHEKTPAVAAPAPNS